MDKSSGEGDTAELEPSELGTKEYWSKTYERDRLNYQNHGDVGEIWFGEDSELRILKWVQKNVHFAKSIIDLGSGNGMMLVELAREGYTELTGVDYCIDAIELSKTVIKSQSLDNIKLKVVDLTEEVQDLTGFNVALDKGTFDAISLNPENVTAKKKQYIENVFNMLTSDGLFIITSCNWTEIELITQFESKFVHFQTIPTPTFSFGGKVGNLVSTVVFKKNN